MMSVTNRIFVLCLAFFVCHGEENPAEVIDDYSLAAIKQFPHQVSLRRNGSHFCGGCIIDKFHILTAAHCVVDFNGSLYTGIRVQTGTANSKNELNGQIHAIEKIAYNDYYEPSEAREHDIAIIKLIEPIDFNPSQQPAKLPESSIPVNTVVLVSGWGYTRKNDSRDHLLYLRKVVMSEHACQKKFLNLNYTHERITSSDICVWSGFSRKACIGDAGSPLTDYVGHVIGISSSPAACEEELPDIFVRVEKYVTWIKSVIDGKMTVNVFPYLEIGEITPTITTTQEYISSTTETVELKWWQKVTNNIQEKVIQPTINRCAGKWFCL